MGVKVPVVIDIDASYRKGSLHLGVKRSPLHTPEAIAELAARVAESKHLSFAGLMAYEAQIAGLGDDDPHAPLTAPVKRLIKQLSRTQLASLREKTVRTIRARGLAIPLFNGGGTGSIPWSSTDPSLTEVTAGSGFFDSHLFDHYRDVPLTPAAFFALAVVRAPSPDVVTCAFGGYIASGGIGPDRAPVPWLPEGLSLLSREGAGEVQTPVQVPSHLRFELGDPILFRHAKAGELSERFQEILLLRGGVIEARAKTYRGMGHCFG
jgi:D-serine deaminase-like pyridoxal phosphate-dependent protein